MKHKKILIFSCVYGGFLGASILLVTRNIILPSCKNGRSNSMEPSKTGTTIAQACFSEWMFDHTAELGIGCALLAVAICVFIRMWRKGALDESLLGISFVAGGAGYALPQGVLLLIAAFCPSYIKKIGDLRQVLAVAGVCLFVAAVIGCADVFRKAAGKKPPDKPDDASDGS